MPPITEPFEEHTDRYEQWFDRYEWVYRAELDALDRLIEPERTTPSESTPSVRRGEDTTDSRAGIELEPDTRIRNSLEVGVGSGRFAAPLGIEYGLDPAPAMLRRARERGIESITGVAEQLPVESDTVDLVLLVTTVCFVDDLETTFEEARRVLTPGGTIVLGYVDRNSPVGRQYLEMQDENPFYTDATFVSTEEIRDLLTATGFRNLETVQTIFDRIEAIGPDEPVRNGDGEGSFIGLKATASD